MLVKTIKWGRRQGINFNTGYTTSWKKLLEKVILNTVLQIQVHIPRIRIQMTRKKDPDEILHLLNKK